MITEVHTRATDVLELWKSRLITKDEARNLLGFRPQPNHNPTTKETP